MSEESVIKRQLWRVAVVCLALTLSALPALWVSAQEGSDARYFQETGHNVSGAFLRFYDEHGGRAIFGYPLTGVKTQHGREVQYFQRARMELHPDAPEGRRVQLGLLGEELGYGQPPIPDAEIPPPTHLDKFYFPETGHTVSFAFLEFFRNHGGLDILGYPISEWIIEPNGRIVQYFQRTKLEWYPENPPGQRVVVGMLGTIYAELHLDPAWLEAESRQELSRMPPTPEPTLSPLEMTALQARVSLQRPIIGLDEEQIAYVYVFDQQSRGVLGASVDLEIQYQDGRTEQLSLEATGSGGYAQIAFEVGSASPGYVVIVRASVRYGDLVAETSTAFLPWW